MLAYLILSNASFLVQTRYIFRIMKTHSSRKELRRASIYAVIFRTVLLFCFGLPFPLLAEISPKDSLLQELDQAISDRERIDLLLQLCDLTKGKEKSLLDDYSRQILSVEDIEAYPEAEAMAYVNLGNAFFYQGKMDSARKYANLSMERMDFLSEVDRKFEALQISGMIFVRMGELDAGRRYILQGWNLALAEKSLKNGAGFANLMGVSYLSQGAWDLATEWLTRALEGYRKSGDLGRAGAVLGNMGIIYESQGLIDDALAAFLEADSLYRSAGNEFSLATLNFNIGLIYQKLDEQADALKYLNVALETAQKTGQRREEGRAYGGIAAVLSDMDSVDTALEYAEKAVGIQEELGNPREIADANLYLSIVLVAKEQYGRAIESALKSKEWAEKNDEINIMKPAMEVLAKAYLASGQHANSATSYRLYHELRDSISNAESIREASDLAARIAYEKEATRKELEQKIEDEQEAAELAQQKLIQNILWVTLLAVLIFVGILTWAVVRMRAQNRKLKQRDHEITYLNQNLEGIVQERTVTLEKRNAQLADYVFTNSHRLRGPIARILGLMQLHENNGFPSAEEKEKAFQMVHTAAKEADEVIYEISGRLESGEEGHRLNLSEES